MTIALIGALGLLYGLGARRSITGNMSSHLPYGWKGFQLALICAWCLVMIGLGATWQEVVR